MRSNGIWRYPSPSLRLLTGCQNINSAELQLYSHSHFPSLSFLCSLLPCPSSCSLLLFSSSRWPLHEYNTKQYVSQWNGNWDDRSSEAVEPISTCYFSHSQNNRLVVWRLWALQPQRHLLRQRFQCGPLQRDQMVLLERTQHDGYHDDDDGTAHGFSESTVMMSQWASCDDVTFSAGRPVISSEIFSLAYISFSLCSHYHGVAFSKRYGVRLVVIACAECSLLSTVHRLWLSDKNYCITQQKDAGATECSMHVYQSVGYPMGTPALWWDMISLDSTSVGSYFVVPKDI